MSEEEKLLNKEDPKPQPEEQEDTLTEEEAEAAFKAGFAKVKQLGDAEPAPEPPAPPPEPEPEPETSQQGPTEPEEPKPAEPEPEPEPPQNTEALDKAYKRIEKLEGRIGNLIQQVGSMSVQPTAAAQAAEPPTEKRVKEALRNEEKLKELVDEFPSFKPMLDEMKAIREEAGAGVTQADLDRYAEQVSANTIRQIENENLEKDYPTWSEEVRSEQFKKWGLEDGPTQTEWTQFSNISQKNPHGAQAIVNSWQGLYPEWWADRGALMFSERPSDTKKLMDKYTASINKAPEPEPEPEPKPSPTRDKSRLKRAATPKGVTEPPSSGISDEEAFRRGFNRAKGH